MAVRLATAKNMMPVLEAAIEQAQHAVGADVGGRAGRPGVAVLGRLDRVLGADRAGGARLVDDDELLLELGLELGGDDACHLVGRAAGRPRHDDGDGTIGLPGVVLGDGRGGEQPHRTADHGPQQTPHRLPPTWIALQTGDRLLTTLWDLASPRQAITCKGVTACAVQQNFRECRP